MPKYKHGKIEESIGLDILGKLMKRVERVNCSGYSARFIQAAIATFYWTGFRRSEVLGDKGHRWRLKSGEIRRSKPFPGLLKENLWVDEEFLYIFQEARKHGKRDAPVAIPLVLPYVDLIVERWNRTKPSRRVFPISYVTFWRICKRLDPKLYPHFFVLNRVTKLAEHPELGIAHICAWTGKTPKTIAYYLARAGRYSREVGKKLLEEK
jgi:hypothetical protein